MEGTWAPITSLALSVACVLLLVGCSVHDIAARTIPNAIPVGLTLLGAAARLLHGEMASGLIAGLLVFGAALLCWRRGWMGGGDVKLLGAAALALPPTSVLMFVAAVAIAGGLLALLYLAARPFVPTPAPKRPTGLLARALRVECWRISRRGPLPYACAIAAGFAFVTL
jgi:prepilin peptidase CpaA